MFFRIVGYLENSSVIFSFVVFFSCPSVFYGVSFMVSFLWCFSCYRNFFVALKTRFSEILFFGVSGKFFLQFQLSFFHFSCVPAFYCCGILPFSILVLFFLVQNLLYFFAAFILLFLFGMKLSCGAFFHYLQFTFIIFFCFIFYYSNFSFIRKSNEIFHFQFLFVTILLLL